MYRIFFLSILENKYLFQILGGLTSKFQPDRFLKTKSLLAGFYRVPTFTRLCVQLWKNLLYWSINS